MSTYLTLKKDEALSLEISAEAIKLKNEAVDALKGITEITTHEQISAAAIALSKGAITVKAMEEARQSVKAPILDAERRIDKMATEFKSPVTQEINRVKQMVSVFQQAEAERVRKENERIEREAREASAAAQRAREAEEKRIHDEAEAERQRLAQEATKLLAEKKRMETAAVVDDPLAEARAASIQAEGERIVSEAAQVAVKESTAVAAVEAARVTQTSVAVRPASVAKVAGITTRTFWTFEVTDLKAVYAARPDLCNLTIAKAQVDCRLREGLRECPGLRIFETTSVATR